MSRSWVRVPLVAHNISDAGCRFFLAARFIYGVCRFHIMQNIKPIAVVDIQEVFITFKLRNPEILPDNQNRHEHLDSIDSEKLFFEQTVI